MAVRRSARSHRLHGWFGAAVFGSPGAGASSAEFGPARLRPFPAGEGRALLAFHRSGGPDPTARARPVDRGAAVSRELDVIIVGAGPVGCVMAALLLARRVVSPGRVAVIAERMHTLPAAGAASAPPAAGATSAWI